MWAKAIRAAVSTRGPGSAGAIGGGRLTNEEAFLLQHVFRKAGVRQSRLASRPAAASHAGHVGRGFVSRARRRAGDRRRRGIGGATSARHGPARAQGRAARRRATIRVAPIERRPVVSCVDVAGVPEAIAAIPQGAARIAAVWDGVDLGLASDLVRALKGRDATFWIASEQGNAAAPKRWACCRIRARLRRLNRRSARAGYRRDVRRSAGIRSPHPFPWSVAQS